MKNPLFSVLAFVVICAVTCKAQSPVLWGLTSSGGNHNMGTIFSYNAAEGTEQLQYAFGTASDDGSEPLGSLIKCNNGLLYGLTYRGGLNDSGTIFSYNMSTGFETDIHDFGGTGDGAGPGNSLIQAGNSVLYGLTTTGGMIVTTLGGDGVLFSYNTNTGVYKVVHNFGMDSDGIGPGGSLIQANDSLLYGLTEYGGRYNNGIVFSYNTNTGVYAVLHEFGSGTDGQGPQGSLMQASNGLLYGMTQYGGVNNYGTIFSYSISTGIYTHLADFEYYVMGPEDGALIQANDGQLYGLLDQAYMQVEGFLFRYNISTEQDTILHGFCSTTQDGLSPIGSLIQAHDGLLYGMTADGGFTYATSANTGIIFSYDISTGTYNILYDFGLIPDGAHPCGTLLEVSDTTTAIQDLIFTIPQLFISPNPTTGQFTIQLPGNANNYPTEIYNVLGEKIEQTVLSNGQNILNLRNQAAGMYFVYVHTEDGVATGKVMITK